MGCPSCGDKGCSRCKIPPRSEWLTPFGMNDPVDLVSIFREAEKMSTTNHRPSKSRKQVAEFLHKSSGDGKFSDIFGNEEVLTQLIDAVEAPVKHAELHHKYGISIPKGALLYGPPGCGKTMFARTLAAEMSFLYDDESIEYLLINGTEIQSSYIGETERKIKAIFEYGLEYYDQHGHPLLVFIDEAEAILPDRTSKHRYAHSFEQTNVATFLSEMDGLKENKIFLLLASNRPEMIDQALLRDGRIEMKLKINRPDKAAVEQIIRKQFNNTFTFEDLDSLTFAALESLFDPNKKILEAHAISYDGKTFKDLGAEAFCLEHILSGAMASSIPTRASRFAFARDKKEGTIKGVTVQDVLDAVNALFKENVGLDHSYALDEFKQQVLTNKLKN